MAPDPTPPAAHGSHSDTLLRRLLALLRHLTGCILGLSGSLPRSLLALLSRLSCRVLNLLGSPTGRVLGLLGCLACGVLDLPCCLAYLVGDPTERTSSALLLAAG